MKAKSIESFVEYKIEHHRESEVGARMFTKLRKYEKILDEKYEKINRKNKEIKSCKFDSKKLQNRIWKQILQINQIIHDVDAKKYKFIEKIRQHKEKEEERKRQLERVKKELEEEEVVLQEEIKSTEEESQYYFKEKIDMISEEKEKAKEIQKIMKQKNQEIDEYNKKMKVKENLNEGVNKKRIKNQDKIAQTWKMTQNYDGLRDSAKRFMDEKKQRQTDQTTRKKDKITDFIDKCNILLQTSNDELGELIKNKKKELEEIENNEGELRDFEIFSEKPVIKGEIEENVRMSINFLKTENNNLKKSEEAFSQQMKAYDEQDKRNEEEIQNLEKKLESINATLAKIA